MGEKTNTNYYEWRAKKLKILIVEDNVNKANDIKECVEKIFENPETIIVGDTESAKVEVKKLKYDICFIDINLPDSKFGDAKPNAGIKFLEAINTVRKLKRPIHVFLISEYEDLIEENSLKMKEEAAITIIKYEINSEGWKSTIEKKLLTIKKSEEVPPTIILALHGINTRGEWRDEFASVITENTKDVIYNPWTYKNSLPYIFWPFWRKKVLEDFAKFYEKTTYQKSFDKIHVVAHSYGTYIVFRAMQKFPDVKFDKIIFLGSPIKENTDWTELENKFQKMFFYIGKSDKVLEWFAPIALLGKSGQKGFKKDFQKIEEIELSYSEHSDCFSKNLMKDKWLKHLLD